MTLSVPLLIALVCVALAILFTIAGVRSTSRNWSRDRAPTPYETLSEEVQRDIELATGNDTEDPLEQINARRRLAVAARDVGIDYRGHTAWGCLAEATRKRKAEKS